MSERGIYKLQERNTRLIDVRNTLGALAITRPSLANLYPYMHYLTIPRGNRRFSQMYIVAYAEQCAEKSQQPTMRSMAEFSHTDYAEALTELEQVDLETRVSDATTEDGLIALVDVAAILNVGRMTVTHWYRSEAIDLATVTRQRRLYVSEESLRDACTWHEPVTEVPG